MFRLDKESSSPCLQLTPIQFHVKSLHTANMLLSVMAILILLGCYDVYTLYACINPKSVANVITLIVFRAAGPLC